MEKTTPEVKAENAMKPDSMKKTAVLSLSGGMDSTCLMTNLLRNGYDEVVAVSFDYGQRHNIELSKAQASVAYLREKGLNVRHHLIDLRSVGRLLESALTSDIDVPEGHYEESNMKATVVPNRNVIFGSIIYGIAQSIVTRTGGFVDIATGIHSGDHAIYPDCRPESRDAVAHAFALSNYNADRVTYITPYLGSDKTGILRDCFYNCIDLGIDFDTLLSHTITSYNPDELGRSSGKSGSDIERIEAFINIGRRDPIQYTEPWEDVVAHAKQVLGIG